MISYVNMPVVHASQAFCEECSKKHHAYMAKLHEGNRSDHIGIHEPNVCF